MRIHTPTVYATNAEHKSADGSHWVSVGNMPHQIHIHASREEIPELRALVNALREMIAALDPDSPEAYVLRGQAEKDAAAIDASAASDVATEQGADDQAHVCETCGSKEDVVYGPDPFASEIHHDDTPAWLCEGCLEESARDI